MANSPPPINSSRYQDWERQNVPQVNVISPRVIPPASGSIGTMPTPAATPNNSIVIVLDDDDIENLTGKSVGNHSKNSK